jgi:hypothetical protein
MIKKMIDAVHDIKNTVALDGGQYIAGDHSIFVSQGQWNEALTDPYLLTLPTNDQVALTEGHRILGVAIVVQP